jgi:hypothetical protein
MNDLKLIFSNKPELTAALLVVSWRGHWHFYLQGGTGSTDAQFPREPRGMGRRSAMTD